MTAWSSKLFSLAYLRGGDNDVMRCLYVGLGLINGLVCGLRNDNMIEGMLEIVRVFSISL